MKPPRYKRENAHLRKKILFERVLGKVIKRLIDIIIALQNGKQMTLKMGENRNYIGNVEFLIFFCFCPCHSSFHGTLGSRIIFLCFLLCLPW